MSGKDAKAQQGFKSLTHHREEQKYLYERDSRARAGAPPACRRGAPRLESEHQKKLHWMRGPKCGSVLEEVRFEALVVDRCESCRGVFFDDGELSILRKLALEGERGGADVLGRLMVGAPG